jgi:hypothetical protein
MKRLHHVFESAAVLLHRSQRGSVVSATSNDATPFDNFNPDVVPDSHSDCKRSFNSTSELKSAINLDALGRANLRAVSRIHELYVDEVLAEVEIPEAFTEIIFDPAEREIKYLVLTNTWPKFVNVGRASSQMSREIDDEQGNVWMKKVLCSS